LEGTLHVTRAPIRISGETPCLDISSKGYDASLKDFDDNTLNVSACSRASFVEWNNGTADNASL
jgi:hypothetical protein